MQPERDYEVGYGRPPKHSQFKEGQSGNPKGRPRKSKVLDSILGEVLAEKITIAENGRRRTINKAEAMFKAMVNKAVKGDLRAAQMSVQMMEKFALHKKRKTVPQNPAPMLGTVILPDNGRDTLDPEYVAGCKEVALRLQAKKQRNPDGQNPANENRKGEVA